MAKDADNTPGEEGNAATDEEPANRRRRLSKRQRKALKRKQKQQMNGEGLSRNEQDPSHARKEENASSKKKKSKKKRKRSSSDSQAEHEDKPGAASDNENSDDDVDLAEQEEDIRLQCMKSYKLIEIPTQQHAEDFLKQSHKGGSKNNSDSIEDEGGCRTLGKWFPNAILVKSRINYTNTGKLILLNDSTHATKIKEEDVRVDNPKSSLVLFYQYTTASDSTAKAPWDRAQLQLLMTFLAKIARHRHLGGRIRVAPEGVNATISAIDTQQHTAQETLRHFAQDLKNFDSKVFANTDFKYLDNLPADRHFKEFKILPVQELVFYDIGESEAPLQDKQAAQAQQSAPSEGGGVHLDAKEYHQMLQKDNTVVIDVRNHYETILGRFDGQQASANSASGKEVAANDSQQPSVSSGAEYIDPKMRKSTDFKAWCRHPRHRKSFKTRQYSCIAPEEFVANEPVPISKARWAIKWTECIS